MDKFAQKRSLLNKLREMTNVSGLAAEKFFNPEFERVMTDLRLKDDNIRSIVAGETIGDGDPGSDAVGLKQLIKQAKSNLNRREYMSAVADLGRFHAKLFEVNSQVQSIDESVNAVHHEFLFKDLDDERKKHLEDLKKRLAARQTEMVKQAGIMDFFHNIGTQRGRALAAWEKRYPKQTKKLKSDTDSLLKVSEGILAFTLSTLKDMAKARATRNVDAYMTAAKKLESKYTVYDAGFKKYYADNVKGFLEKINLVPPAKEEKVNLGPDTQREGKGEVFPGESKAPGTLNQGPLSGAFDKVPSSHTPFDLINRKDTADTIPGHTPTMTDRPDSLPFQPTLPSPRMEPAPAPSSAGNTLISPPQSGMTMPPSSSPTVPSPPPSNMGSAPAPTSSGVQQARMSPQEMRALEEQYGIGSSAHARFYSSLESMSNESPIILKAFISKYAKKIEATDLATSIQLLNIVKSIKG